jgi:GNAT superfamily N-acetyltransferase
LAYDLEHSEIPQHRPSIEIELRLADIGDAEKIGNIQGVPYEKKMTTDIFRTRLDAGFLCFVADYDGQIVGVDWASDQGNEEYDSVGLNFEMEEGSCYGFELYEDRNFAGKGVGLALLAYALAVCKERGFKRQIGWVDADNVQMLSSSVQLLGAKKIGEFQVRRIFNKPHARWTIGGTEGSGNVVSV